MEDQRTTELEKAQIKTEMQIQSLAKTMEDLTKNVESLREQSSQANGILKLLSWGLLPLILMLTTFGGYFKTQYDAKNIEQDKITQNLQQQVIENKTEIDNIEKELIRMKSYAK